MSYTYIYSIQGNYKLQIEKHISHVLLIGTKRMKTLKKGWVVHYVLYRDFPLLDPLTLQCNPHDDSDDGDDRGNDDDANNVDGDNIDQFI